MFYYCLKTSQQFLCLSSNYSFSRFHILFVRIVILMFFGKKWIWSDSSWFFCVLCYIFLSFLMYLVLQLMFFYWICSTIFIKNIFFLFLVCSFADSYVRMLYFWRVHWLFTEIYVWELNSSILLIHMYCRTLLLSACERRWWISIPLIFCWHFDLLIWSITRLWTGSSPRCPLRSHSLVCIENHLFIVGIGPIINKELEFIYQSYRSDRTYVYT